MLYKTSPEQGINQKRRPLRDCCFALVDEVTTSYTRVVAVVAGGKWPDSRYILKVETMEFADAVGVSQRKSNHQGFISIIALNNLYFS